MPKTTIQGMPRDFSQNELNALIQKAEEVYKASEQSKEIFRSEFSRDFFLLIHNKLNEGWGMDENLRCVLSPMNNLIWMTKPEPMQEADLAVIREAVRLEYINELKQEREHYKQLLIQQLQEADDEKEAARLEKARVKKQDEYLRMAEECYGDLLINTEVI